MVISLGGGCDGGGVKVFVTSDELNDKSCIHIEGITINKSIFRNETNEIVNEIKELSFYGDDLVIY